MKTWRIVALALSAMLIATSVALLTAAATGGTWETAAGWLEAIATVAALGAAVAAALLVARTVQIELNREGERLDGERRSEAVLVAVWPHRTNLEFNYEHGLPVGPPVSVMSVDVGYLNASSVPIYDVLIELEAQLPDGSGHVTSTGRADMGTVRPQCDECVNIALVPPLHPVNPADPWGLNDVEVFTTITFRDAANRRWRRTPEGLFPQE